MAKAGRFIHSEVVGSYRGRVTTNKGTHVCADVEERTEEKKNKTGLCLIGARFK